MTKMVTLHDGTTVAADSQAWQFECLCMWVMRMTYRKRVLWLAGVKPEMREQIDAHMALIRKSQDDPRE